jgi:hypothetical protein
LLVDQLDEPTENDPQHAREQQIVLGSIRQPLDPVLDPARHLELASQGQRSDADKDGDTSAEDLESVLTSIASDIALSRIGYK